MVDTDGFNSIEKAAAATKRAVDNEKWLTATVLWSYTQDKLLQATGNIDFYNILYKTSSNRMRLLIDTGRSLPAGSSGDERDFLLDELMNNEVKNTLDLNVKWGAQSGKVFSVLSNDFMRPVTHTGAEK